jgi:DNA-binding protein WhiA
MSFSSKIKDEIIGSHIKNSCCRRALLHGIISSKANLCDGVVVISVENTEIANFISTLIKEFFGRDAFIGSSSKGGRCKFISFKSAACEKYILDLLSGGTGLFVSKCPSCNYYFYKGLFLGAGRISDPQKQYCLEFSLGKRINLFAEHFEEVGLYLKIRQRAEECILYTKNSSVIEDFFAIAEIQSAAFEIINTKIEKDFLNNANRGRNLDTVNIKRSVDTGNEQANILYELEKKGLLYKLPDELLSTAKLRMQYPDYTLNQLAIHSVPPLTKSGVVHRLSKIMKLAKELLNN